MLSEPIQIPTDLLFDVCFFGSPSCSVGRTGQPEGIAVTKFWDELGTRPQREQLARLARRRNWGLSLLLIGWLHLLAFSLCYCLTIVCEYHGSAGYLSIWIAELLGVASIFRACGGRPAGEMPPLGRLIARVWVAYFLLAFNLGTMNTLRGHEMFELFPAMASLASFAFLVMAFVVDRRFFLAVPVLFASGLLMAAYLPHAYLVFALAWWAVLNGIGVALLSAREETIADRIAEAHANLRQERFQSVGNAQREEAVH